MGCVFGCGGIWKIAGAFASANDGGVVAVGGEDVGVFGGLVGVTDHAEEGAIGGDAIDGPAGVEDFVAAMFAVGLGEHVELDVGGVAVEGAEFPEEVVDFVGS